MAKEVRMGWSGERALVDLPYEEVRVRQALKTMIHSSERKWNQEQKYWEIPVRHFLRVKTLCEKHGLGVEMSPRLLDRVSRMAASGEAKELEMDYPLATGELMTHQRQALNWLTVRGGRGVVADEQGLGKTLEAIVYMASQNLWPVTIVCPASLKYNWQREIEKWLSQPPTIEILRGRKSYETDAQVRIVNYDIVSYWVEQLSDTRMLICDEAHALKNSKAARTKAAKALAVVAAKVILLTGTPLANRPRDLYQLLNLIAPSEWSSYMGFAVDFCNAHQKSVPRRGGGMRTVWDFSGSSNEEELYQQIQPYMLRRTKDEVLDLPARSYNELSMNLEGQAWLFYRVVYRRTRERILDALQRDGVIGGEVLAQIGELRREAGRGRFEMLMEWIHNFMDSGEKLVIFAHHVEMVENLAGRCAEYGVATLYGKTPDAEKATIQERFNHDDGLRVLIANFVTGGMGYTFTAASNVLFAELPWTWTEVSQAGDRVHRIGQTRPVSLWFMLATNTIEAEVYSLLMSKREIAEKVIEGVKLDDVGEDVGTALAHRIAKEAL